MRYWPCTMIRVCRRGRRHGLPGKDISQFPVKVREIALWVMDGSDGQIRQLRQALRQQAQDHALVGAGIALDQGEAPSQPLDDQAAAMRSR